MKRFWAFGPAVTIAVLAGAPPQIPAAEQSVASPRVTRSMSPQGARDASSGAPQADDEKTLFALGVLISRNLDDFQLSPAEFARVEAGLTDGFSHRGGVDLAVETPKVQALRRQRVARLEKKREDEGKAYVIKAASLPGAKLIPGGAVLIPLHDGGETGPGPGPNDQVTVNYEGKLIDGTVFDGSVERGQPTTFSLSGVIPCWAAALPLMKTGDKSRIVCPPDLAYGAHGAPPKIGPQSTLDFEVELLGITPGHTSGTEPTAGR